MIKIDMMILIKMILCDSDQFKDFKSYPQLFIRVGPKQISS